MITSVRDTQLNDAGLFDRAGRHDYLSVLHVTFPPQLFPASRRTAVAYRHLCGDVIFEDFPLIITPDADMALTIATGFVVNPMRNTW